MDLPIEKEIEMAKAIVYKVSKNAAEQKKDRPKQNLSQSTVIEALVELGECGGI